MTTYKVWLREPHQTNDEAIKLLVDEGMDVSDVLLKVPDLLRVQHLKPSEIQAEFNEAVLSNRAVISVVFEGSNEGTLVIRPRPGVVLPETPPKERRASELGGPVASGSSLRRPHAQPPPSPRNRLTERQSGVTPDRVAQRRPSNTKPPVAKGISSRGPTPTRGPPSARGSSNVRCPPSVRGQYSTQGLTPTHGSGEAAPRSQQRTGNGKATTEHTTAVPLSRSATPTRDCSSASRYKDPKIVPSRFRQEAAKVKAPVKRDSMGAVCDAFKPQWAKPLCGACGHSKQAHRMESKRKTSLEESKSGNAFEIGDNSEGNFGPITSPEVQPVVSSYELNGTPLRGSDEG